MPTYKVLVSFELDGVEQEVDSQIELSEEDAAEFLSDGRIELVTEGGADAPADTQAEA